MLNGTSEDTPICKVLLPFSLRGPGDAGRVHSLLARCERRIWSCDTTRGHLHYAQASCGNPRSTTGECGLSNCREFAVKLVDVACLERCLMPAGGVFGPSGEDRPSPGLSESGEIIGVLDGMRSTSPCLLCREKHPAGRIYIL